MSINFKFLADASQVHQALDEIKTKMGETKWSEMMVGTQALIGLLGQAKSAVEGLVSSFLAPAAALEDAAVKLGVMFGDRALGDELASSLERMATNGVISFQELQDAAGALVGVFKKPEDISKWVGRFADIAAGSKMTTQRLAEMVARLDDMGKAEFAELANAGIPIYQTLAKVMGKSVEEVVKLGAEGKVSSEDLLAAFAALTEEGGKFYALNAEMSNTTAGSWATLLASVQEILAQVGTVVNDVVRPLLQSISAFLQENKETFAQLLKFALRFVAVWAGFKVYAVLKALRGCVSAMVAMVTSASGLLGIFRAIGRVGWILLITTAVEALMALYDRFFNGDKLDEAAVAAAEREANDSAVAQQAAQYMQENSAAATEPNEEEDLNRREIISMLNAVNSVEKLEAALERAAQAGIHFTEEQIEQMRRTAKIEEHRAKIAPLVKREADYQKNRDDKERMANFKALSSAEQWERLVASWKPEGVTLENDNPRTERDYYDLRRTMDMHVAKAIESESAGQYEYALEQREMLEAFIENRRKELAEEKKEQEELARSSAELRTKLQADARRDALVLSGDKKALAAFDDEQERKRLSADYQAAGFSAQEADWYAAQDVARKRKITEAEAAAAEAGGQGVQMVASSLAAVGGGGVAHRLGDAQLTVSRKQLSTMESIRSIVSSIATKATGIPVVA